MPDRCALDIGFWFPRPERGAKLAEGLRQRGHSVTIYHSLPIPGDQTFVRQVKYDFMAGLRAVSGLGHDVLYTSRSFLPVTQLRVNKLLRRRPYVYTLNGAIWAYHAERKAARGLGPLKRALYPAILKQALVGAGAVVANSRFLADGLTKRYPSLASKVTHIYNGIDYDAIDSATARPDSWIPGDPRVLSVVTLTFERKIEGVHLLLDAFAALQQSHPDASYLIAAKSSSQTAMEALQTRIDSLDCSDRVKLEFNRTDVPDLLAAADLFLYATPHDSSDSLPRALLEAQAAGVPTVTTATTGCAEVVLDGETGRAVAYDAGAIAVAASELLGDEPLARRMADSGSRSVRERFQWDAMADAYEELFLQVANHRPR
jgi:glycosyltransferase involved in cell wall biosynthesis